MPDIGYVINADGTGGHELGFDILAPAWSPDGSKLVFQGSGPSIYVINADGTGRVRLTTGTIDRRPVWSPDGTKIICLCRTRRPDRRTPRTS